MTEPTYGDYIAYHHGFIISVAIAQRAAGGATLPEIGVVCRKTAECMGDNMSRSLLLGMAETLEAAGVDGEPTPRWTPQVIPGGKDDGGQTAEPQPMKETTVTESPLTPIPNGARGEMIFELGGESFLLKLEFGVLARIEQELDTSLFERITKTGLLGLRAVEILRTTQVVLAANGYQRSEQDLIEGLESTGVGPVLEQLSVFLREFTGGTDEIEKLLKTLNRSFDPRSTSTH